LDYDISIDHKNKIVVCASGGKLDIETATAIAEDARKQALELGYSTLYDVRDAPISIGILDAYYFLRDTGTVYKNRKHRSVKAAILYGPDKNGRFRKLFEATALNTGLEVMVFYRKNDAVKWLSNQ